MRRLNAKNQLKRGESSSGCESRPAKAEPSQPEASLATVVGRPHRRCVDRRAGEPRCTSPENSTFQDAQGVKTPEGPSEPSAKPHTRPGHDGPGEEGEHLAGLRSRGASEEDGPETWDLPRPSRRNDRPCGEPVTRPRPDSRPRMHTSREQERASAAGSPKARGTGAEDDGDRGPEGCVVVMTPGNG
jgi:hypothetical protein